MEKITTISREIIVHKMYCDECGGYIGESEENEDGYYTPFGVYEREFYMPVYGRYNIKKTLCTSCREKTDKEINNALIDLGFKKGK